MNAKTTPISGLPTSGRPASREWIHLTGPQIEALPKDTVVLLPVGAVEQHGPHLPVGTDMLINRGIVARAMELLPGDIPLIVLPEQAVGASTEHARFAGTLSHPFTSLLEQWKNLLRGVARLGLSRVLVYNTHGGNHDLLYPLGVELRDELGILVCYTSRGAAGVPEGLFDLPNLQHDIHAGAIETSIMMALYPELVVAENRKDFASRAATFEQRFTYLGAGIGGGRRAGFGWMSSDLNADGCCGNALAAEVEAGRVLVDHAAAALVAVIKDVHSSGDVIDLLPPRANL